MTKKRLKIDWMMLEMAADHHSENWRDESAYLDAETGRVLFSNDDTRMEVDAILEELDGADPVTAELVKGTQAYQSAPEWQQPAIVSAVLLATDFDPDRYLDIPTFESHESYEWMREFAGTVADKRLQQSLFQALDRHKPFRGFADALFRDRREQFRWQAFEREKQQQTMLDWLAEHNIEPVEVPEISAPELPPLRDIMLERVLAFVNKARRLEGVSRIALIGSLATEKEFPKDIDLLVTVADDMDLTTLAKYARQLGGSLPLGAGGDVFLADPRGAYLGRTCPWKNCGPGIRISCDALHCGDRHFLHDDLKTIRLGADVIEAPPLILWPKIVENREVPDDVRSRLIAPLATPVTEYPTKG